MNEFGSPSFVAQSLNESPVCHRSDEILDLCLSRDKAMMVEAFKLSVRQHAEQSFQNKKKICIHLI